MFSVVHCAGHPAVAVNVAENCIRRTDHENVRSFVDVKSLLDSIYSGFMFAVPKSRRSREKRAIRRYGWTKVQDWMTPRRNLVECLDCGEWHEGHTICGEPQYNYFCLYMCIYFYLCLQYS